jgi:hypothetical protein
MLLLCLDCYRLTMQSSLMAGHVSFIIMGVIITLMFFVTEFIVKGVVYVV